MNASEMKVCPGWRWGWGSGRLNGMNGWMDDRNGWVTRSDGSERSGDLGQDDRSMGVEMRRDISKGVGGSGCIRRLLYAMQVSLGLGITRMRLNCMY